MSEVPPNSYCHVARGHPFHGEAVVCRTESLALLEDRQPAQSGLIDLQEQTSEEGVIVGNGKAVFPVVVRPVNGVSVRRVAVRIGRDVTHLGAESGSFGVDRRNGKATRATRVPCGGVRIGTETLRRRAS